MGDRCCTLVDGVVVCGARSPAAAREAAARVRSILHPATWREARENAGLSLGQAGRLLEVPRDVLDEVETGRAAPSGELRARMVAAYDAEPGVCRGH